MMSAANDREDEIILISSSDEDDQNAKVNQKVSNGLNGMKSFEDHLLARAG